MLNGEYATLYVDTIKLVYGSTYHYTKQVLFSTPSSNMVPRGSPLKVNRALQFHSNNIWWHIFQDFFDHAMLWFFDCGVVKKVPAMHK